MYFTPNGLGRKNGFRFEIRYSPWRDGEAMDQPYYLFIDRAATKSTPRLCTYTEHSLRFFTEDTAKAFCELIADGKTSFEDIIAKEKEALKNRDVKFQEKAIQKVDVFFDKMAKLGVNPALVQDIVREFLKLDLGYDERANNYFEQRIEAVKTSVVSQEPKKMTLADHMSVDQQDIDVCLVDKDTGEHILPAICYLDKEEQTNPEYDYSDWEKWVLSLPLDHIAYNNGCPMAVVNTEFTWDETCFLIDQREFESEKWNDLFARAEWAGADFKDRLAFLSEGRPFELTFNGIIMNVADPDDQGKLIELLSNGSKIFIAPYEDPKNGYYAYSYHFNSKGRPVIDGDVDIRYTEPGKGLTSTLEGKIAWAKYVADRAEDNNQDDKSPSKTTEKEM